MSVYRAFLSELLKIAAAASPADGGLAATPFAAPLALGGAAGVGALALLRRPSLAAKGTFQREVQEAAKGKLTRVMPASSDLPGRGNQAPGFIERMVHPVLYGSEVLYSHGGGKRITDKWGRVVATPEKPLTTKGAVWHYDPRDKALVRGDISPTTQVPEKRIDFLEDKWHQAQMLEKYVPGSVPRTELLPPSESPDKLLATMRKRFPNGFLVKTRRGTSRSVGVYSEKDINSETLKKIFEDPNKYIVQERHPLTTEFRVHTFDGRVVPGTTLSRWRSGPGKKEDREAAQALAGRVAASLPKYRRVMMGQDIGIVRTKEGPKAVLIETNAAGSRSGQSGFVDPRFASDFLFRPWHARVLPPHRMNKVFTGRYGNTVELGGAGVAAGGTVIGAEGARRVYLRRKRQDA